MTSTSGRLTGTIAIVAALALLIAGAADARTASKVIASGGIAENSGGKVLEVGVTAAHAKSLSAKVILKPAQKLTLDWTISCSNHDAIGANQAAGTKQMSGDKMNVSSSAITSMPLPIVSAKHCSVSLLVYLTKKANATAKVQVLQT